MPAEVADESGAERVECGDPAVDVEVAFLAGGEGEGAGADGFLEEEFFQLRGDVAHLGSLGQNLKNGKSDLCAGQGRGNDLASG